MEVEATHPGLVGVGAYLRTLRGTTSRAKIAAQLNTHESQLVRIEAGVQDTRGSQLIELVSVLKGKIDDVARLLLNKATAEEGEQLARCRLAEVEPPPHVKALRERLLSLPHEDLELMGQIAERMQRERQSRSG